MTVLRQRMIEDMPLRGLAARTREAYVAAVEPLAKYRRRSPDEIAEDRRTTSTPHHVAEERRLPRKWIPSSTHSGVRRITSLRFPVSGQDFKPFDRFRQGGKLLHFALKLLGACSIGQLPKHGFRRGANGLRFGWDPFHQHTGPHFSTPQGGGVVVTCPHRYEDHRQTVPERRLQGIVATMEDKCIAVWQNERLRNVSLHSDVIRQRLELPRIHRPANGHDQVYLFGAEGGQNRLECAG
jgi:hypothetical protein